MHIGIIAFECATAHQRDFMRLYAHGRRSGSKIKMRGQGTCHIGRMGIVARHKAMRIK